MRISVSISEKDAEFLDAYTRRGDASRSAVVRRAIELLREQEIEHDYLLAWREWDGSDDARLWERAGADGLADAQG